MKLFLYLFWLAALLNIAGEWAGFLPLRLATKPLLMIFLGTWYFTATGPGRTATHRLVLVALAFSWAGDVFLMKQTELFFLLGLASFLIAHLLYIIGFGKEISRGHAQALLKAKPWVALPVLLLFAGLLMLVFGSIPADMKAPVVVYASVITAMVIMAINRYGQVDSNSFIIVAAGALLFMLSDSIIALNKFYFQGAMWKASFLIMLLYISGQYLIARGTVNTA